MPAGIETGASRLVVIANGLASPDACVTVLAADVIFADTFDLCSP